MGDRLDEYRRKRDAARTPEPVPKRRPRKAHDDRFVIQQHHARALHWDLRLEREGVLVSWAVPRGMPRDQVRNHLAVHTEDHPMEYLTFAGDIPAGEYGGGRMVVYDTGTYETEKWKPDEVMVTLHGDKVSGRYVLFRTSKGDAPGREEWMVRRMDPPAEGWTPMPSVVRPMRPTPAKSLPDDDVDWALRDAVGRRTRRRICVGRPAQAHVTVRSGHHVAVRRRARRGRRARPDRGGGRRRGGGVRRADRPGAPGAGHGVGAPAAARAHRPVPVVRPAVAGGSSTVDLPYAQRRELLDGLGLNGANWQTPPAFTGGGAFALDAAREQGLAGVVAKRLDSPYVEGKRSPTWLRIDA